MKLGMATYSPEDNKLRFYPDSRLSKDDYNRARENGFKWAPAQKLFVAPMWTPSREDLLLEWCGEIGDEDKSLVDRAEERAERFEDYSEKRKAHADNAHAAVESICEHIPLGQPILVGHHSERHARKDAERIENGMRKAVKMWEQSKYWQDRAASAVSHAKYKELPDVRARRIKGIEADKRKQERAKAQAEHLIRFWEGKLFAKNPKTGERRAIEIKEENRAWLCELLGRMSHCGVSVRGLDGQGYYSAWDILRPEDERYKNCPVKTVPELQAVALRLQAGVIAHCNRWIAHYENRLAYERAMLVADGGTVTDQTRPEVGGACRCWVRRGYCEIVKVNKVSVTVMDSWSPGGPEFRRTVPFDKLSEVISKAQWEAMKNPGKSEAQVLREFNAKFESEHIAELDALSYGRKFAELGQHDRDIVRNALRVKLGIPLPEGGTVMPQPVTIPKEYKKPERTKFDDLKEQLKAGVQIVSAPQLFQTPPDIAARMVELANPMAGKRVLEPSAGTGRLIEAAAKTCGFDCFQLVAVEVNASLLENLKVMQCRWLYANDSNFKIVCADFLSCNGDLGKFDRILMNPPFQNGADIQHIKHAATFLNPGGRLVAICANGPRQQEQLKPLANSWEELPEGTFKEQGTNVRTALLTING